MVKLVTRIQGGQDLLNPHAEEDKGVIRTNRELEELVSELRFELGINKKSTSET
jgi:hypothetical protein